MPRNACFILANAGQQPTGPGGFAEVLPTVPVVLEYVELIRKHAKPHAWIVDFTNPVGIFTRAPLEPGAAQPPRPATHRAARRGVRAR
ncbi:hypothetical protein DEJ21_04095 [Curtobacterium sp. MCSS17_006]|nr:hypothetical protein [Curtobacterium sp. MCSS17_006]PZE38856.1 hypothetical protein DEJ21_04095 [Curtobacterium sp. MCSS17_006]